MSINFFNTYNLDNSNKVITFAQLKKKYYEEYELKFHPLTTCLPLASSNPL